MFCGIFLSDLPPLSNGGSRIKKMKKSQGKEKVCRLAIYSLFDSQSGTRVKKSGVILQGLNYVSLFFLLLLANYDLAQDKT